LNQSYYSYDWTLTKDAWHKVVFNAKMNTAGVKNGVFKMWVDGVLRINATDVLYLRSGQAGGIASFSMTPVYGGVAQEIPSEQYMWFAMLSYSNLF
jgi:hypothetical protein